MQFFIINTGVFLNGSNSRTETLFSNPLFLFPKNIIFLYPFLIITRVFFAIVNIAVFIHLEVGTLAVLYRFDNFLKSKMKKSYYPKNIDLKNQAAKTEINKSYSQSLHTNSVVS